MAREYKKCPVCKTDKPIAAFYRHHKNGTQYQCKDCNSNFSIAQRLREHHEWRKRYGLDRVVYEARSV